MSQITDSKITLVNIDNAYSSDNLVLANTMGVGYDELRSEIDELRAMVKQLTREKQELEQKQNKINFGEDNRELDI